MRRVDDGLDCAAQPLEAQLVERQGHQNRHREAPQQAVEAQQHGVDDHPLEGRRVEEALKVLQADPRTSGDALACPEIAEGDLDAIHRTVFVHDRDDDRNQKQHIELPVIHDALAQRFAARRVHNGGFHVHPPLSVDLMHETFHVSCIEYHGIRPLSIGNFRESGRIQPVFHQVFSGSTGRMAQGGEERRDIIYETIHK